MLVNKDSLIIMLSWLKGNLMFNDINNEESIFLTSKKFKWETLTMSLLYSDDELFEITTNIFESIMLETLPIIKRLKNVDIVASMKSIGMEKFLDDDLIKQEMIKMSNYENIVHELFITECFTNQILLDYQIQILKEKLEILIRQENYEQCSIIQSRLKVISE